MQMVIDKRFEPMSTPVIMPVCSLFSGKFFIKPFDISALVIMYDKL